MKKKWKTPKLVVLARGKPEEAVLGFCKTAWDHWDGPIGTGCGWHVHPLEGCDSWSWT
jgi:hypothetical protein